MFATVDRARPTRLAMRSWREAELVDQPAEAASRLDRIEVLALEVLHERDLEPSLLVELANDRRDPLEAGGRAARSRRSPATSR